jgi:hypothetical protein
MSNESKKPTHRALIAKPYKDRGGKDKTRWITIGSAWPTENGKGFSVRLDSLPLDGRLVIMPDEPKAEANAADDFQPASRPRPAGSTGGASFLNSLHHERKLP